MWTKLTWTIGVKSAFWISSYNTEYATPGAWAEFMKEMDVLNEAVKKG